jgi:D-alanyl-D-alanine carboxypeptidase/D-alanyl-D-alanine-endopeptidase (penicillin-binding protein 4)
VALTFLGGYLVLDAADAAPGVLTTRPAPPPPPTETPGTRTLPLVPQPIAPPSAGGPLPALAGESAAPTPTGVEEALADVLRLSALDDASLVVRDGQDGTLLLDIGGDELRIPASTTKMLSAAAVGQVFGPDERLVTRVVQGETATEIVLVAGGDALLAPRQGDPAAVAGRAGLGDLADQVSAQLEDLGIDAVTLSVDASYAPGPTLAPTWSSTFRPWGITSAVAMLGRSDQRATPGLPGPADPVAATAKAFAQRLEERGITVDVTSGAKAVASAAAPILGSVESAPVREQLALAVRESDNGLMEVLARQAAFRAGAATDFPGTGTFVVDTVAALGVDMTGTSLVDASGLSRENQVTAEVLAQVLVLGYDGKHPVLRAALDGLPVGGLSGTLSSRFTGPLTSDAAGRARAKTGTLTGANALAGSVVGDDGRLIVFAGLVGDAGTNEARSALDRFVAALAACGCR